MSQTIEFFTDPASPYAYLAATQIEAFAKAHDATLVWKPMLLGKVFEASSNRMPASVPAKAKYMFKDLSLWAKLYQVPFAFPKVFPLNSVLAARVMVAAENSAFSLALLKAYWAEGHDLSQPDVMATVITNFGLDAEALLAKAASQPVKDTLRVNTEDAITRGVFGAPTFFIGKQMFWGNDRLPLMAAVLKGEIA